jgi:hypothetical protein
MVNSANTDWKITDLWNVSLFTFDTNWRPVNENQASELDYDKTQLYNVDVEQQIAMGRAGRDIVLSGKDVSDKDKWTLSSTIARQQLMKLWCGEDWFYYVIGIEPRQVRDVSLPMLYNFTCAFRAVDPHYYYSYSDGGAGSGKNVVVPTTMTGSAFSSKISTFTLDLSGATASEGTTFIEPVFWIVGGASTSVTAVVFTDTRGRTATYTPTTTIANTHVHVIMPWRNTSFSGFTPRLGSGFSVVSGTSNTIVTEPEGTMGGSTSVNGTWALDVFNHGAGTDDSTTAASNTFGAIQEEVILTLSRNGTTFIPKPRNYPRAEDGVSNSITCTVTGTETDCKVFAQYCVRRI